MPKTEVVGEIEYYLTLTRDYILERGWAQHTFRTAKGAVCLSAAIGYSCIYRREAYDTGRWLFNYLVSIEEVSRYGTIIGWNDYPGRTLDEVIWLLDDAIEEARETGA